ncbi:hypothetical protein HZC09_01495 [Candidatus Micrarchaeota archaeon]|nr:hypothetical protein [Candidatus Micrarchaeota archaeon]
MKVAVIGRCTPPFEKGLVAAAEKLGSELAKRGHVVLSGACAGLPHYAVDAAYSQGAKTVGYSPAADREQHVKDFSSPFSGFSELRFYGDRSWSSVKNFTWRSAHLVDDADAVLCIDGSWGTVSEIALVFITEKPFGVLETGGAASFIREMEAKLAKRRKTPVIYERDPVKLVERTLNSC